MGLCLSHCGQAQHKAAVVAVSISNQSSASPALPPGSSDHQARVDATGKSLKQFLHLYSDGKKVAPPRASLDDSLVVPHSSELFSLPSEGWSECDGAGSRSSSPARGSVTSVAGSSSSSPSGRTSGSVRSGRSEKALFPPRSGNGKSVPGLESASDLRRAGEPETSLVETIARLEKFCDVKVFLEKRSSVRRSASQCELSATCARESSIDLLHNSCRDLALKLLCFSNEHARHISHGDGDLSRSVRRCDSAKEMKAGSLEGKECLPLEKSVASFLEEAENFVSKVDAPADQRPAERVTDRGREEGVSRLPSQRFLDADEKIQFTDFEATFESPRCEPAIGTSPSDWSLGTDQPDAQDTQEQQVRPSKSAECELARNSAPVALRRRAHGHSSTTSDSDGVNHIDVTTEETIPKKSLQQRLALTEIDSNLTPANDPLTREKERTPMERKRGVPLSLDLQDNSTPQLAFGIVKGEQWELTQGANNVTQDSPVVRNSGCPNGAPTPSGEEAQICEAADSATTERFAREEEGCAAPPPADASSSQPQPTKGRSSVDREEPIDRESTACTGDTNAGGETSDLQGRVTGLLDQDSKKSLSIAFDNLFKLLQNPATELAQDTSALLERLGAQHGRATRKSSVDGSHLSDEGIAPETQAESSLSLCEAESWHDAPASLSTMEQPELHNFTE